MDLRHLEYFVAVAEELSFTAAARRLHVVQSAVSAGLRRLERELAIELFDRTGRGVRLTGAGGALLPEARRALAAAQAVRDVVDEVKGGLRGTVHVAVDGVAPVAILDVADLLARVAAGHPGVTVALAGPPVGPASVSAGIVSGAVDVGLVTWPGQPPTAAAATHLGSFPMVVACQPRHPLAGDHDIALAQLAHEPFVDLPEGTGARALADRVFATAEVQRRTQYEVADAGTAMELIRHGLGIGLLPAAVPEAVPSLSHLRIVDVALRLDLWLLTVGDRRGPLTKAFVEELAARD